MLCRNPSSGSDVNIIPADALLTSPQHQEVEYLTNNWKNCLKYYIIFFQTIDQKQHNMGKNKTGFLTS